MSFTLGLLQLGANPRGEDFLVHAVEQVRRAAAAGAQIVALPELFRSSYFCQQIEPDRFALAEPIPGPSTDTMSSLARELGVVIIVPIFEHTPLDICFNTAVVIDADGSILGAYRKSHIPDDPLFHEKFYFTPGDTGFRVFHTRFARLAVLICWDQWFPEAARLATLSGAEVLVFPTAIGRIDEEGAEQHALQLDSWRTVQRAHAIANGCFVAAVNRAGRERGLDFWGHSFVAGPQGELLCEAGEEPDRVLVVPCSRDRIRDTRRIWPFLRDRRVDLYAGLVQRSLLGPSLVRVGPNE